MERVFIPSSDLASARRTAALSRSRALLSAVFVCSCAAASSGCGTPGVRSYAVGITPRTRAEQSAHRETSTQADVLAFLDSLRDRPALSFGTMGVSRQGRSIPYVIASRPGVSTPAEARALRRPIVYVQGNIHGGEVEGKEALLAILRDLTRSTGPNALDSVVLIAVPVYNPDGNDSQGPQETNRQSQNGPALVGERANGQGLDLNRDYIKVEAPETRAALAIFRQWDPEIFVDLHTTNGSYHGYALTYAPSLNPAAPLGGYTRDELLPVLRRMMRERGFATFDYGDFISADTLSKGWTTFDHRPRYGTNYYGLRGNIAILSEAYSHDPFSRRVAATYAFVHELLSLVAERASDIRARVALARSDTPGRSGDSAGVLQVAVRSEITAAPAELPVRVEVIERTGDSARTETGMPRGLRRTGRFEEVRMPVFDRFRATLVRPAPAAYAIRSTDTAAMRVLDAHGIQLDTLALPWRGMVEEFVIDSASASPRVFQGQREMRIMGRWRSEVRTLPRGTRLVPVQQPLAALAAYLLEPESDDGLVTWNFFDDAARPGAVFPVLRIVESRAAAAPQD